MDTGLGESLRKLKGKGAGSVTGSEAGHVLGCVNSHPEMRASHDVCVTTVQLCFMPVSEELTALQPLTFSSAMFFCEQSSRGRLCSKSCGRALRKDRVKKKKMDRVFSVCLGRDTCSWMGVTDWLWILLKLGFFLFHGPPCDGLSVLEWGGSRVEIVKKMNFC